METAAVVLQIVIALGIINVWILRPNRATSWRGGAAANMREEFAVYGLPVNFMRLIGTLKLSLAALVIAGIWLPALAKPAAISMAILMTGAIAMHVKVKDPIQKSLPAFTMLVLSLLVALA